MSISSKPTIFLQHQPLGEQHPYIPLPYERSPRDPLAGRPVYLNLVTGRMPVVKKVRCIWQVEGIAKDNELTATLVSSGDTTDQWQVELPPFKYGEVVHYRFQAASDGESLESEEYSFAVSTWEDIIGLVGLERTDQRLKLDLATTRNGLILQFLVEVETPEIFTLGLSLSEGQTALSYDFRKNKSMRADWDGIGVVVQFEPFKLEFKRAGDGLNLQTSGTMRVLVGPDGKVRRYQVIFESPSDEAFYGFGERFNALDQRGNHLDNYVYGQYTGQGKRSYIPIPFFISSRGYGLWLQTDQQAEFDLAFEDKTCWSLIGAVEDENARLTALLYLHRHPHEIIKSFTGMTGKPLLPPAWVFGLWMSSNDWNSQAEVLRQLHQTQALNIPATVLVIEAWSDEINFYIWNDAHYPQKDPSQMLTLRDYTFPSDGRWTDPKRMIEELHQAGLRLVLWQNPTIKHAEPRELLDETQNKIDQEYAIRQGYVVTKEDGSPHRAEAHMPWFAGSLVLDFSNPKAAEWWFGKRDYLVSEMGVDGFKTDGGEHIWDLQTRYANGMRGSRGINTYPVIYERAYRLFMENRRGQDYVLFSRAGYTGAQQNPCHWAGDENSTWEAFCASVNAMLNVGICGVSFMGWDIAGFAGPIPTSELYLRATAFSVFCPIMQYHSDVNGHRIPSRDRTPWNMQKQTGDAWVIPTFRNFANLRMNLLPYILEQARSSSLSGLPLMRSLTLEFPEDRLCRKYPHEYLFGDALLVAPVVQEGVSLWKIYLPEGGWRDLWTGRVFEGPAELEVEVPIDRIPVYQKRGSLLPLNLDSTGVLCCSVGNSTEEFDRLILQVFPAGKSEYTFLHSAKSDPSTLVVEMDRGEGSLLVRLPVLHRDVDLVIVGSEPTSVEVNGSLLPCAEHHASSADVGNWYWKQSKQETWIRLPVSRQETALMIRKSN